jgi:hypothetical protein
VKRSASVPPSATTSERRTHDAGRKSHARSCVLTAGLNPAFGAIRRGFAIADDGYERLDNRLMTSHLSDAEKRRLIAAKKRRQEPFQRRPLQGARRAWLPQRPALRGWADRFGRCGTPSRATSCDRRRALLLVVLDGADVAKGRVLRIAARIGQRPTLSQQIPALV